MNILTVRNSENVQVSQNSALVKNCIHPLSIMLVDVAHPMQQSEDL